MITALFIGAIVSMATYVIGTVTFGIQITAIPYVDSYLVTGFGYWEAFLQEFPPMQVVWHCFLWYVAFEVALIGVKLILGNRIKI